MRKFKNVFCQLVAIWSLPQYVNILRPGQNGPHFPDNIFKWIFLNGMIWISIKISLKFVSRGPNNNIPALIQIMAWHHPSMSWIILCHSILGEWHDRWVKSHKSYHKCHDVYSLAPRRCNSNLKSIIFKLIIQNTSLCTQCEIVVKWMPQEPTNEKSTFVQVMAWCHQATSHYLS